MPFVPRLEDALDTVYFTADLHLGHKNIIKYCDRPFDNVEQHDRLIIGNFNSVVKDTDTVYCLGDFTLGDNETAYQYISRLKGKWVFLPGSHDRRLHPGSWMWCFDAIAAPTASGTWVTIEDSLVSLEFPTSNKDRLVVVLCHYAMRVWDRSHYGSYHLYGHSHGKLSLLWGRSMDVGIDVWDYYPVPLRTVITTLENMTNPNVVHNFVDALRKGENE